MMIRYIQLKLLAILTILPASTTPAPRIARLPVAPIHPVKESDEPVTAEFLKALNMDRAVTVYYHGGASPGLLRQVRPRALYRLRPGGPVYAIGECRMRCATRIFRLDRVRLA